MLMSHWMRVLLGLFTETPRDDGPSQVHHWADRLRIRLTDRLSFVQAGEACLELLRELVVGHLARSRADTRSTSR